MKILFAAPFTHNKITFFISNYFKDLATSAREMGHDTKLVKTTDTSLPYENILFTEFNIFNLVTKNISFRLNDMYLGEALYREVEEYRPDILFLHLINSHNIAKYINKIRNSGTLVLTWLGVHPSVVSSGIHTILRNSDYTLIYDESYRSAFKKLGINNILKIPLGCNTDYFDTINVEDSFLENNKTDIAFIGTYDNYRHEYLNSLKKYNLGIWSWNINNFTSPLKTMNRGSISGKNLVKVLKSTKIALNIHREYENSGGNYRMFEIPATGAFQIVDYKKDIRNFFKIGYEIVTFDNETDLKNKIDYYLVNEDERIEIAKSGYERVKKEHNLKNRLTQILEHLNLNN